jgi:hypothetical protein
MKYYRRIKVGGLHRVMRRILAGVFIVATVFAGTLWAMGKFWPNGGSDTRPTLAGVPALPAVTRTSTITAPVAVAHSALRALLDTAAPRDLSGKNNNPIGQLLSKAEVGVTMARGPISVSGRPEALTISTPVNGTLRVTGQIATQAGNITGLLGGVLGNAVGKEVQDLTGKLLDQRADVRGNVAVVSRPTLTPAWRIEPNLTAQVTIGDGALSIAGIKINVGSQVKPLLDNAVNEQVAALQERLRNDPTIEQAARREWAKMCGSIPLGGAKTGLPELWLEVKPTRAFAAQPRIDASNVTLTVGVQAETRILPTPTKPDCPFPARLDLGAQADQGRIGIGVPIDVPFTEVSRLLEQQLKGRSFPEDGSGPVDVLVQSATVAASGDRLLISLQVKAQEKKSWFGFGAEAIVHVWGRPLLDQNKQILRLIDIELAVESEAAFGLLGAAARAAMPHLQNALAQNAVIDLKPFAANAREKIGAAIADFRKNSEGVRVDAAVTDLHLVDIAFDSKTLRVIAEAAGTVKVAVTELPGL